MVLKPFFSLQDVYKRQSFACAETESVPVNVIAEIECEVMLIDSRKILHPCCNTCEFHSRIIFNLMKSIAAKNLLLNQKIEIISKRTTREMCIRDRYNVSFTFIETGTKFIKDRKLYTLPNKRLQSEMAFKSRLSFHGKEMLFKLKDSYGMEIPKVFLYKPYFRESCLTCGSRPICNGSVSYTHLDVYKRQVYKTAA